MQPGWNYLGNKGGNRNKYLNPTYAMYQLNSIVSCTVAFYMARDILRRKYLGKKRQEKIRVCPSKNRLKLHEIIFITGTFCICIRG
jgi:hypothetical protein